MEEQRKQIPWREGKYWASNQWRIKNSQHVLRPCGTGRWWNTDKAYLGLTLHRDGKPRQMKVHRLIAITRLSLPWAKIQVNHKDGNPQNNNPDNLERVSDRENKQHAKTILHSYEWRWWLGNHMKWKTGALHPSSKPVDQYDKNTGQWIKRRDSMTQASIELSVLAPLIGLVCSWKNKSAWWFLWRRASSTPTSITPPVIRNPSNSWANHSRSKVINQIDKYTNQIIKQWYNQKHAAETLNIKQAWISSAINWRTRTAGGFKREWAS